MYDDKLQDFTHLVGNNDQPSDKVLIELKEALAEPNRLVAGIDTQIRLLEQGICKLRQDRLKIEDSVASYRPILSPMRRVPSDILFTIFMHCLATHRNPTMSASEAPMLLTRVCSGWRTIAMASPRLWARIHIPFQSENEHIDTADELHQFRDIQALSFQTKSLILQTRCKAVHEWLLRSRECPLSISIFYPSHVYGAGSDMLCNSTMKLLDTIFPFVSRWRSVELTVPFWVYSKLESMIINAGATLSNLEQVRIAVSSHQATHYTPDSRSIGMLKSPSLKRISGFLPYAENRFLALFDVKSLPWSNLTHFSNHTPLTVHDAFAILKYCPRLIHAGFILEDETGFNIQEPTSLPFLESLWITETRPPSSATDGFYRSIHAPSIRWIRHRGAAHRRGSQAISNHHELHSILPLLENSVAGIRILELQYPKLQSHTLRKMIEIPSVTFFLNTLHVHCAYSYYSSNVEHIEPFDLHDLIVDKSADNKGVFALLPRLENFEMHKTKTSDETVLDFITSRIDPTSPVYVLKKIKIIFNRPQDKSQMDLEEEVRKRAAAAGVNLDLTIQYLVLDQNNMHPVLSPSTVIGNADSRLWEFEDLLQKFVVDDI